jgi:ribosomal protein L19
MKKKGDKIELSVQEYENLKDKADQFDEVLMNISNRILEQNLDVYKRLANEDWKK